MQGNASVSHPFDEWFASFYPDADSAVRATALISWNAAVHVVDEALWLQKDHYVQERQYEQAVVVRDLQDVVRRVVRPNENGC